jgi:UDP-N-acetylglucosamine--N-acetylmuramyl-(pentapeptide) pyrophosphoryl-undecaprenol N-acetylglucosamine transferase
MKKVFIAGGGTGGHFYPAYSLAEYLHEKGYEITYIGAKKGIEGRKDFPFGKKILLDIEGVRGKGFKGKIISGINLLKNSLAVREILRQEKPDFSVCFGGYASLPLGLASALEKVPLYIHEQNSVPSYTNKLLSFFSKKIFITFDYSRKYFPKNKTILSGMPLRKHLKERLSLPEEKARKILNIPVDKKSVLVFGGSQGAKKLTEIALEVAKKMKDVLFIVITGKNSEVENPPQNVIVYDYVEDMGLLYKAVDIVISRAGAGTVSEILLFGKYSIFVPYPYAASNHQFYNVHWLYEKGLASIITEEELTPENLISNIKEALTVDRGEKIKKFGIKNAEEIVFQNILETGT